MAQRPRRGMPLERLRATLSVPAAAGLASARVPHRPNRPGRLPGRRGAPAASDPARRARAGRPATSSTPTSGRRRCSTMRSRPAATACSWWWTSAGRSGRTASRRRSRRCPTRRPRRRARAPVRAPGPRPRRARPGPSSSRSAPSPRGAGLPFEQLPAARTCYQERAPRARTAPHRHALCQVAHKLASTAACMRQRRAAACSKLRTHAAPALCGAGLGAHGRL